MIRKMMWSVLAVGVALIVAGPMGGPAGTTAFDAGLHGPQPTSFWALTSNV